MGVQSVAGKTFEKGAQVKIFMTIPYFLPSLKFGGSVNSTYQLAKGLVALGHEVEIFTTTAGNESLEGNGPGFFRFIDGVKVRYFRVLPPRKLYHAPTMKVRMEGCRKSCDIIHAQNFFNYPAQLAMNFALSRNIPYVVSPRGMVAPELIREKSTLAKKVWLRMYGRKILTRASAIHVTSDREADDVRSLKVNLANVVKIYNGIEPLGTVDFQKEKTAERGYFLFLGRIDWKKGLDRLILAVSRLPESELVIAGNDESGVMESVMRSALELGLSHRVRYVGYADEKAKTALFKGAIATVVPSINENFGNVVLESMSSECPVIVTEGVGAGEIVKRWSAGLVSGDNPDDLAANMRSMLQRHPEFRNNLAVSSIRIKKDFSWDGISRRFLNLYTSVIEGHGA